jgi:hypothetical protein
MRLFPRKRMKFRKFEPPAPRPAPPIESLVDEGLLILSTGIRMAVKNQAILWVLRDGDDFDHERYLETVRDLVLDAADEAVADADRIAESDDPDPDETDESYEIAKAIDPDRRERRQLVLRGMSERLAVLADDEAYLAGLALEARDAAWDEIGGAVTASALRVVPGAKGVTGEDRDRAMALVRFDLEEMEQRRDSY